MKLKIGFLLPILLLVLFSSCLSEKSKTLKVMTWNIWHGGLHGSKASDFESDTANTINVLKVIQQEDPDILFMQETYCCGMEIAKEAGYAYSWRGSSNLSIHSKYPILDTLKIYKDFNSHGAIIDVEGQHILCFNIWLHYLPASFRDIKTYGPDSLIAGEGETRLKEIREILRQVDNLDKSKDLPIIMGGDFNSHSHLDWVESTRQFHYDKVVEWPVSKMMEDRGYTDSFREVHPDPTLSLEGTWGYLNDEVISDRIDYIFYRAEGLRAVDSKIVMDDPPGGFFNSDHRAILTTFQLKP